MTDPLRLDLHVHSVFSPDGRATPAELVARARVSRLDGFALTDHNSAEGIAPLEELARAFPGLRILPGIELSTREGHLLAFGIRTVPARGRPLDETIEWVREQGGEPVPAHPFRWVHGVGASAARRARVGAIEVVNGHTGRARNGKAAALARERGLGGTGGSDAHRVDELGRAVTLFPADLATTDDILEAIRRGRTIGEGASLDRPAQFRSAVRSALLRVRRGFRPV
jgi:predicted metal-dependent phosphoesterase TrpH